MLYLKITEEQKQQRRVSIIQHAFHLFCKKGVDNVSMKEIAAVSGVGVASVFRYFSTKAELLMVMQKLYWSEIYNQLTPADKTGFDEETGFEQVRDFLEAFYKLYENHGDYILFSAQSRLYLQRTGVRMAKADFEVMIDPVRRLFIRSLEKGARDGTILLYTDPDHIFYTIWGIMRGFTDEVIIWNHCLEGDSYFANCLPCAVAMILDVLGKGSDIGALGKARNILFRE